MITRRAIQQIIGKMKSLATIGDLAEYAPARDRFLERALPLLRQSKRTAPLADAVQSSLAIGLHIPGKGEATPREIEGRKAEALAGIAERIDALVPMLRAAARPEVPVLLLAMCCLAGGLFTLVYFGGLIDTAGESARWPWVTGYLSKSRLHRHASSGSVRYGTRMETATYGIAVEYRYFVDAREYRGRTFSFEPHTEDRGYWEAKARQYPPETRVRVYYDPGSPEVSVLETGAYERNYIFIAMGLAFAGFGACLTARAVGSLFL